MTEPDLPPLTPLQQKVKKGERLTCCPECAGPILQGAKAAACGHCGWGISLRRHTDPPPQETP